MSLPEPLSRRPFRRALRQGWKLWLFLTLTFPAVIWITQGSSPWLSIPVWTVYIVLILIPAAFGAGPLGRRLGRELNEDSIARARAERAALGPPEPPVSSSPRVPSGPGGETRRVAS